MSKKNARVDSMAAGEFVTLVPDTFRITVKDDEGKEVYKNDEEPFSYPKTDSLVNGLRHFGAELSDDAIQFINTALEGEETGKAVLKLIDVINGYLYDSAKGSAYAKVLNEKKPASEESMLNSQARMVRDFMRQSNVDASTAIQTLKQFVPTFKDYTLEQFKENKGKV